MAEGRKLMSRGFGESKPTPTASREEFARVDDGLPPREDWTIAGKPVVGHVSEALITWEMTDQAIVIRAEEQARRIAERGGAIAFGQSPEEKSIRARKDAFDGSHDPLAAMKYDGKKNIADEHRKPGTVQYYVPKTEVSAYTGPGGYDVVKDQKGQPVEWKDQYLLERPLAVQQREDMASAERSRRQLATQKEEIAEFMERQASDAGIPVAVLRRQGDFGLSSDDTA
jgi:hypothetical protein